MSENVEFEVEVFIDYLINDLDQNQLAVLYYQALHSTAGMINDLSEEEDEPVDYNDLHDNNLEFLTSVIKDNHSKEVH